MKFHTLFSLSKFFYVTLISDLFYFQPTTETMFARLATVSAPVFTLSAWSRRVNQTLQHISTHCKQCQTQSSWVGEKSLMVESRMLHLKYNTDLKVA